MTKKRGTARIRGLAAELKDLRAQAGLNIRDAASQAGLSTSKLNRIELGSRVIELEDMVALLVVYGVTGLERERLLAMTREANLPGWWETTDADIPKHVAALINFEAEATRIVHVALLRIPGLMQTPAYIRAVMASCQVIGTTMEARTATRLGRQAVLTRSGAPQFIAILDEATLRRPVGGPRAMAQQLRHVASLASFPHISVRVVPFERGDHIGLDGTFVTMEFARARPIVYLEHKRSSGFVDEPSDVAPFQEAVDTLLEVALDSPESVDFIAHIAAEFDQR
jgi:transcriptional regulator with XRE-family HTH domain